MIVPGSAAVAVEGLPAAAYHDIYDTEGSAVYHRLTARDRTETREVLRALRNAQGAVLELACGSGRLTISLLAAGFDVTAIDLSPAMIALLREEVAVSTRVRRQVCQLDAHVGDMRDFSLPRLFASAVLGTSSITLLDQEERAACFACVRRHLYTGGRFLVSTIDLEVGDSPVEMVSELPDQLGTFHEYVDPAAGRRWTTIVFRDEGGSARKVFTSAPRLVPSESLGRELEQAGFEVVERHLVSYEEHGFARAHVLLECLSAGENGRRA